MLIPALHFQRACRQCVHESARLSRALCSHAWYSKNRGERQNRRLSIYPLLHILATHYFLRLTRARGKSSQREGNALFDDFWYFSSRKSTIKEKLHYDSSLSEFFSLVRKERKGQKEERIPLLNTFCRLAATGANTLPRPSNHSIAAATGSKRSSADSDSLLCHVGLWRTSRLKFWCVSRCEHSEIRFILIVPSAHRLHPRPPHIYMRACRQCVHESARLFCALCSHAW